MHFCQDELFALFAAIPVVRLIVHWVSCRLCGKVHVHTEPSVRETR